MTSLTAQYQGECDHCQGDIETGEPISRLADGVTVHLACELEVDFTEELEPEGQPKPRRAAKAPQVCPECRYTVPCYCD